MRRQYKGSLTVEAALVVPVIIFIITAFMYLCFFLHDRLIIQSYCLREAESIVWDSQENAKPSVFMIRYQAEEDKTHFLTDVLDVLGSRKHATVTASGTMQPKGSGKIAGGKWQMEKKMRAVRVNYAQDRLVTTMLKKEKK